MILAGELPSGWRPASTIAWRDPAAVEVVREVVAAVPATPNRAALPPIADQLPPIADQPPPEPSTGREVWPLVVADMLARDHVGRARYGTPLRAGNGRDALIDAYQEALDLAVYLRQAIDERGRAGDIEAAARALLAAEDALDTLDTLDEEAAFDDAYLAHADAHARLRAALGAV